MAPGYNIVTWVKVPVPCASGRMTLNFSSYGCLAPPKSQSWTQWSGRRGALIRNKTHTCNMPLEVKCRGCSFQYQQEKRIPFLTGPAGSQNTCDPPPSAVMTSILCLKWRKTVTSVPLTFFFPFWVFEGWEMVLKLTYVFPRPWDLLPLSVNGGGFKKRTLELSAWVKSLFHYANSCDLVQVT